MTLSLDYGCGKAKRPGCVGIDADPYSDADIFADITEPVPGIGDASADFVCCTHVLEHIPYPHHWKAINEMMRALKVGGHWEIIVPHPGNDMAMVPDHKHVFSKFYFEQMQANPLPGMIVDEIICRRTAIFDLAQKETGYSDFIIENCFRNTIQEMIVKGRKVPIA